MWLLEAVVFFFELFVDFDVVDDFFLLAVDELACEVDVSVVVARAGSPRAWTSKQKVRKRANRRPKELTALQCSAISQAAMSGCVDLTDSPPDIRRRRPARNFIMQYFCPVKRLK